MSNQQLTELEALEGWLIKKKRKDKTNFFGKDTKRWFKIQKIKGSNVDDLCMCYFKGPNDDDPSGWIYLKDVRELSDDGKIFNVITTQRKIVLEAQSKAEHKLWIQGLVDYCPFINSLVGVTCDINYRRKSPAPTPGMRIPGQQNPSISSSPARQDDNEAKPGSFVPRERTFSRHIMDQDPRRSNDGPTGVDDPASFRDKYSVDGDRAFINSDSEDPSDRDRDRDRDRRGSPKTMPRKKDLTRGGGVGTMGANAGSSSSRMYAHIAKTNSSNSLSGAADAPSSVPGSRPRSRDTKDEADIDTDYTSLAADRMPVQQRLRHLDDDDDDDDDGADAKESAGDAPRPGPLGINTSPASGVEDGPGSTPKGPVSHFQTASGAPALPTRDMKSSIDDIISRSSSQCNSARRPPPISSYSPRTSVDQPDDDDDLPFDISAEKMRYSSNADSKDERPRSDSTTLDEKGNPVSKPPLGRTTSGSTMPMEEPRRRPPPSSAPPPSKYNAHLAGAIQVDSNFVSDKWDSDSDEEDLPPRGRITPNFRSESPNLGGSASSPPTGGSGVRVMHSAGAARSNASSRGSYDAGVKADENWMDDNFDM